MVEATRHRSSPQRWCQGWTAEARNGRGRARVYHGIDGHVLCYSLAQPEMAGSGSGSGSVGRQPPVSCKQLARREVSRCRVWVSSYQGVHVGRTLSQVVRVGERQRLAQHGGVRLLSVRPVTQVPRTWHAAHGHGTCHSHTSVRRVTQVPRTWHAAHGHGTCHSHSITAASHFSDCIGKTESTVEKFHIIHTNDHLDNSRYLSPQICVSPNTE